MKKLNLKMGGIKEMLTREQMKKVVGGYGYGDPEGDLCVIKFYDAAGNVGQTDFVAQNRPGSAEANNYVVNYMAGHSNITRGTYDCASDGFGH